MASKKWEDLVIEQVANKFEPTFLGVDQPRVGLEDQPNFKVYEFSPNRKLDGDQRYLLAGPEWQIMLQTSLLKAEHDLLGNRLGFTIDFEEWFEAFEYEFMKALPPSKRPNPSKMKPWGKEPENRPKKLNLLTKEEAAKRGYMIIRFWKDRKQEDSSILLAGTYTELRWKLEELMRDKPGTVIDEYNPKVGVVKRAGKPQIFLYFLEDLEDVEEGYAQVKGIISFRIMNKDDDPDSDTPKITKTDLEQYANAIKQQFYSPQPYEWNKGKEMVSYCDWDKGYQLQLLCRSEGAGLELVQRVLAIQGHNYNATRLKLNVTKDAASAYPTIPPQINVLGRTIRAPRIRPVATVKFQYAQLQLQNWPTRITLLNTEGEILPNWKEL